MKTMATLVLTILFTQSALALDCHGTEPFWSASITEETVVFTPAGMPAETARINGVDAAAGFQAGFMQIYKNNNGPVAIVTSNQCNNGMSDDIFAKEVILLWETATFYGCCGEVVVSGN